MNPVFGYVLGTAVGLAVVACAIVLIRVLHRLQALIARLEGTARWLETSQPKIDRILDGLDAELVELRGVTEKANRIAGSAESVATGVKVAVQPFIGEVAELGQSLRQVRAAAVAVHAGISAWRERRRSTDEEPAAAGETNDES
jgi:uncharacterized protein YoxC